MTVDGATAWVLHIDLDQFLAAVEVLRRPELRGRPVVVGGAGDPTERRKVVAAASYEARAYGIRSGMPLRTAARLCPEAVFLPTDRPTYEAASTQVMDALRSLPVIVEVFGWDEAFLGARTDGPELLAADVQRTVRDETGLACSIGIGDNKLQAKHATSFAKPAGIHRLTTENWMAVMGDRPADALWGIGARTAKRLAAIGVTTVAELARADHNELASHFGPTIGPYLKYVALGLGDATVTDAPRVPRGRSRETTYPRDLTDGAEIAAQVAGFARDLATEAVHEGRTVTRVSVKVRFAPFFTQTRVKKLAAPSIDPDEVEAAALVVLDRFDDRRPVRLIGVRVEFGPGKQ